MRRSGQLVIFIRETAGTARRVQCAYTMIIAKRVPGRVEENPTVVLANTRRSRSVSGAKELASTGSARLRQLLDRHRVHRAPVARRQAPMIVDLPEVVAEVRREVDEEDVGV